MSDEKRTVFDVAIAALHLSMLTDEERMELFSHYCKYCGTPTDDKECYCMRDE
jgi:hypothetical protein